MKDDYLGLELDFWDDSVGAFEPLKVLRQLEKSFPDAVIDPTDHQRAHLLKLLKLFAANLEGERHETMIRQVWGTYQTCGPLYKFVIPFASGHKVSGSAARLCVDFWLPKDLTLEHRGQLLAFLTSLRMGEPKLETFDGEAEPDAPAIRTPTNLLNPQPP